MRSLLKFIGFLAVVCVVFIVAVAAAFYYLVREGDVRRFLISEIERKTELKLELGDSELEIGRILGIRFRDVAVSEPDGGEPAIRAEGVTVRIALLPLLERKLIFYEIRLRRPSARLFQGKDGKIPLLDRLANLPFPKHNDAQFALDLRAIRINGGEIEFLDYSAEGTPVTTRLRDVDLELDRMGGTALRELFQKFRRMKPEENRGTALNFELRTGVERDSKQAKV
ncbi:MAG TPA: AsmA family protein, partial [Candidatus Udaeobacter sp.]|nr:AsmA family protein [Candidatus Udaeobacter sp.]